MRITGKTQVYLIVGDPVEQVRAPEVFNLVFERTGIDAILVPARIAPQQLDGFIRTVFQAANVAGMFLAIPHKAPAMRVLDECSALARAAGAVNAIRRDLEGRLIGALFDGQGFVSALDHFGIPWRGKRTLVIGAGGGASAIAASLAAGHAASVTLYDPVPGKALEVAVRVQSGFPGCTLHAAHSSDPAGFDVVVNASPLGLGIDDPLPCDVARIEGHACVVDILMKNQPTPFVRGARARGLVAQPGFEMLIQQAPHYLEFFGHTAAAQTLRQNADFVRELVST